MPSWLHLTSPGWSLDKRYNSGSCRPLLLLPVQFPVPLLIRLLLEWLAPLLLALLPPPLLLLPLPSMGLLLASIKKNCSPARPRAMEDTGAARPCRGVQSERRQAVKQSRSRSHAHCSP